MQRRAKGHEEGWLLSYADLVTNLLMFFVLLLSASAVSKTKLQQIAKSVSGEESPASLESIQRDIEKEIARQKLEKVVRTDLTDEGLELSLNSGLVFDSGSATLRPDLEPTLKAMLQTLTPYSSRYAFAVEGHTDSTPLVHGAVFATNWELSSSRAISVRNRLEDVGIEKARIRVEGYADTKPLPEALLQGLSPDERRARHRRVVVRIY